MAAERASGSGRHVAPILAALLIGTVVFTIAYASAASLVVSSNDLGASAATARCDPNGVTSSYTTSAVTIGADVVQVVDVVTVAGIADACFGRDFAVTLADGSVASLAERRLTDVPAGDFAGTTNARTLAFDFLADQVPASSVVAPSGSACCYVAIFDGP